MGEWIELGYILLARRILFSDLMDKPPLFFKLFVWMLLNANHSDRGKLKRGQRLASIEEMQQAMSYKIGYRKVPPSKDEIRSVYEGLTKTTTITTTKTTRGMIITILNYDKYQTPSYYEAHNETHDEDWMPNTIE